MPESVREQLLKLLIKNHGLFIEEDEIKDDSHLIEDLGLDSLDFVELVVEVEEEFEIDINDEAAKRWITFGDVVSYLEDI